MARVVVTVPGERVVEEFTALVHQTSTPSPMSPPPHIGVVEISQSQPTELIPGPMGPQGPRGSRWFTGDGDPVSPGIVVGDMYLDDISGDIWVWDGTGWVSTGTNIQGSPDTGPQILAKLAPVDGAGSGLDADTLDGQHGAYYLDYDNLTDKPTSFPPGAHTHPQSDVTNLVADLALKAPLASPTFTGDPKAPTPLAADNDTSIATTAFVKTAVGTVTSFPEAPVDGLTYGRKDATWATIVGGAVISDTPPPGPLTPGQLWYESDSGNTYLWYSDADSQQWVQQNIQPATPPMPSGQTALSRNRIVNGAMQISQENAKGTALTVTGSYPADQWIFHFGSGGVPTLMCYAPGAGYGSWLRMNSTTADAAVAASDFFRLRTYIEGNRIADFNWGTASAKQVVVRFWARSSILGTFSVSIRTASEYSYVKNFTFTQTGVWTEFSFIVPGPTVGTWSIDTAVGLSIDFTVMAGSNYTAPSEGAWVAGGFLGAPGISNWMSVSGQMFDIRDVGLYLDPNNTGVAPPWQMPDEAEELRACQRYYEKGASRWDGHTVAASINWSTPITFVAPKRVSPAVAGTSTSSTSFATTSSLAAISGGGISNWISIRQSVAAGAGVFSDTWIANARM